MPHHDVLRRLPLHFERLSSGLHDLSECYVAADNRGKSVFGFQVWKYG